MTVQEVTKVLEERVPRDALDWDNVGLLVGDGSREVRRVYLALDATEEAIDCAAACKADLLVTHHPMIFSGVRAVTADDFVGRKIIKLISSGISCYAAHTNYDMRVMGEAVGSRLHLSRMQVLDVCGRQEDGRDLGIGVLGELPRAMALEELAGGVRDAFGLARVKVFGGLRGEVRMAAVVPGSGKSEIPAALAAGAHVLITGDIDHHSGMDAAAQGLAIIDAGHYGLEHIFMEDMAAYFGRRLPQIEVTAEPLKEPFQYI